MTNTKKTPPKRKYTAITISTPLYKEISKTSAKETRLRGVLVTRAQIVREALYKFWQSH